MAKSIMNEGHEIPSKVMSHWLFNNNQEQMATDTQQRLNPLNSQIKEIRSWIH